MRGPSASGRLLAVDAGGTKTDIASLDLRSGERAFLRRGPLPFSAPVESWVAQLGRWIDEAGGQHRDAGAVVVLSSAGIDLPEHGRAMRRCVERAAWAARAVITNDTYAVLRSGFNDEPAALPVQGVAVTCGTGINCLGVRRDGRADGFLAFGETSGDWGGANDLGMAAVWHAIRAFDGRGPTTTLQHLVPERMGMSSMPEVAIALERGVVSGTQVGTLAPIVFDAADIGDAVAVSLLERLAFEVLAMVRVILGRSEHRQLGTTVVLGGALLARDHPLVCGVVRRELSVKSPDCRVVVPSVLPVEGALRLAADVNRVPEAATWISAADWAY